MLRKAFEMWCRNYYILNWATQFGEFRWEAFCKWNFPSCSFWTEQTDHSVTMSGQMKTWNKSRPRGKVSICLSLELPDTNQDDLSLFLHSPHSLCFNPTAKLSGSQQGGQNNRNDDKTLPDLCEECSVTANCITRFYLFVCFPHCLILKKLNYTRL